MVRSYRSTIAFVTFGILIGTAAAQPAEPAPPLPAPPASLPPPPGTQATALAPPPEAPRPEDDKPKQPKRGDFDAGGQVRLPNGPDDMGQFATFNWIALDLKGRYFLLDSIVVDGKMPLAVKKPDMLVDGATDPRAIGGVQITFDIKAPKIPQTTKYPTTGGLIVSGAYMREGAMLLSDKDYPLFVGDFKPGFTAGFWGNVKLSSLLDMKLAPVFVYQAGTAEAITAVQLPVSTVVAIGEVVKLSVDLAMYTGDDFSFRPSNNGRLGTGAALDVKLGPIIAHAGAGFASLLTGESSAYPTISDSVYIDLNVKYAK